MCDIINTVTHAHVAPGWHQQRWWQYPKGRLYVPVSTYDARRRPRPEGLSVITNHQPVVDVRRA